jgi:hypothetical protein
VASESFLSGADLDPVLVPLQAAADERHQQLTNKTGLAEFRKVLTRLLEEPYAERMIQARQAVGELGLKLRDNEIQRELWRLRMATSGRSEPVRPGERLDLSPTPWRWEGLLLDRCAHLLVAAPKVGKSSLGLALVAAWHRGDANFLDRRLIGPCPPVILAWPDQGEQDCARMISSAGLLAADGGLLSPPLVALFHAGRPIHLDPEGIERLVEEVRPHHGALVILDSYSAATRPLGLEEASAEFAMPLVELIEALEPHKATLLVIHHAGKARSAESPTSASRGSTALPAAASQVLSLARVNPQDRADRRLMLSAEGRGGPQEHLLIERQGDEWICHGSGDEAHATHKREQHRQKLTDRQAAALALVERRWRDGKGETTSVDLVVEPACDLEGKNAPRLARKTLQALGRMELVVLRHVGGGLSARPWGTAEGPGSPPSPAGPTGPAGPQIGQPADGDECGDLRDQEDLPDRGDQGDLLLHADSGGSGSTSFDSTPLQLPRRTFKPAASNLDAKACGTTPTKVADFKRRHDLPRDDRLSEASRALLLQELEADRVARKGEQLARDQSLALIAERATPEAIAAIAAVLPQGHYQAPDYLLNRVEALTGKRFSGTAGAYPKATALAPAAAPAAKAFKGDRWRRCLFWGVILRLDQLEGPPPADPEAFYSWCQLQAYEGHQTPNGLSDLMAGRMSDPMARVVLDLPATGPLDPGAIRAAYRAQARTAHPDTGGNRHRFEQLAAARDRLLSVSQ